MYVIHTSDVFSLIVLVVLVVVVVVVVVVMIVVVMVVMMVVMVVMMVVMVVVPRCSRQFNAGRRRLLQFAPRLLPGRFCLRHFFYFMTIPLQD